MTSLVRDAIVRIREVRNITLLQVKHDLDNVRFNFYNNKDRTMTLIKQFRRKIHLKTSLHIE